MTNEHDPKQPSIWGGFLQSLVDDQKDALRFAGYGAVIGLVAGTSLGIYGFATFGWFGIGAGAVGGVLIGAIGLWLMYQLA